MKTHVVSNYTFDKAAKTVTFTSFSAMPIERIISVIDLSNNKQIYYYGLPSLGGSIVGNVLTLTYDTNQASFENSDKLLIEVLSENFSDIVVASAARSAAGNTSELENIGAKGAMFIINVSGISGSATPTVIVKLQALDVASSQWMDIPGAVTASITATGMVMLTLYPGIADAANSKVAMPLPRRYRLAWTITGTTPSITFSVSSQYIE